MRDSKPRHLLTPVLEVGMESLHTYLEARDTQWIYQREAKDFCLKVYCIIRSTSLSRMEAESVKSLKMSNAALVSILGIRSYDPDQRYCEPTMDAGVCVSVLV